MYYVCFFSVNVYVYVLHVCHIVSRQCLAVRLSLSFLSCPHKLIKLIKWHFFQYHVMFGEKCSLVPWHRDQQTWPLTLLLRGCKASNKGPGWVLSKPRSHQASSLHETYPACLRGSMFDFCYERTGAQESKLFVSCFLVFPLAGFWHLSLSEFQRCNKQH